MSPNGITKLPPIQYPTVTIGGKILTLKVDNLALYMLDSWGVDLTTIGLQLALDEHGNGKPGRIVLSWRLFAAMVAHNYVRASQIPSPQEWAALIQPEQATEIFTAVNEAMLKARPAAAQAPAPTAQQKPEKAQEIPEGLTELQ